MTCMGRLQILKCISFCYRCFLWPTFSKNGMLTLMYYFCESKWVWPLYFIYLLLICLLILNIERETSMWERSFDWLPPICTVTGDWTHHVGVCPGRESKPQPFFFLVCGMTLQTTEPPGQGSLAISANHWAVCNTALNTSRPTIDWVTFFLGMYCKEILWNTKTYGQQRSSKCQM